MCFGDVGCVAFLRLSKNALEFSIGGSVGDVGVFIGVDVLVCELLVFLIDKVVRDFLCVFKVLLNLRWCNIFRLAFSVNKIFINV